MPSPASSTAEPAPDAQGLPTSVQSGGWLQRCGSFRGGVTVLLATVSVEILAGVDLRERCFTLALLFLLGFLRMSQAMKTGAKALKTLARESRTAGSFSNN